MFRVGLLFVALSLSTPARPPIEFVQPRAHVILAGPRGVEIPIQIRVEPHTDNRSYVITWCGDGASAQTLDGDQDSALHPEKPLIVRVYPGACELTAAVYGPNNTLRARVTHTLSVCGGGSDGDDTCGDRR